MPEPGFDLGAYLTRIGHDGPAAPTRTWLSAVHQAHVAAIPFENLDILLGRRIALDLPSVQAKLVTDHRGGYCFEQNALFKAALETVGFQITALAARVRAGATAIRPRTHMLLLVDLPEGRFLADVGFGGDGPLHPMPLLAGVECWSGDFGHRLRREADLWVLEGNTTGVWSDLYAFTLEPQHAVDYLVANHFTSTHPDSIFVQSLTVQRSWPGRRAILRNRELVVREGARVSTVSVADPGQLLEILAQHFSLSFSADTRFSRPIF